MDSFLNELLLFLPVGVIGLYRWSVWLAKKLVGAFYRPQPPCGAVGRVSVVTPVYKEDPRTFETALESWLRNDPHEIIAVIDAVDAACIRVFEDKVKANAGKRLKLIVTTVPGKRPALARGVEEAAGEIVALVDSDTIWQPDCIAKLVAPFSDSRVGGVTCRQRVLQTGTLSQKLTDLMFDLRYEDELRFLGVADQGFSCLSGRTAVYRRSALVPILDGMVNETFFGRRVISGEDKRLTYLLLAQGHKTRYQGNVIVYTTAPEKLSVLLKQKIRWTRNSWRADLRALGQRWVWRRPVLAIYLADKCVSSFTVVISPMIFLIAVVLGYWALAASIPVWWLAGRSIKLMPYLRRKPQDFWMVGFYVLYSFVFGVMRIYALVTLNRQGWLTRGHASSDAPGAAKKFLRVAADWALTASLLLAVLAGVIAYSRVLT